jgi:hypothetical protein
MVWRQDCMCCAWSIPRRPGRKKSESIEDCLDGCRFFGTVFEKREKMFEKMEVLNNEQQ